ncbi:hypothetical protein GCM10007939_07500 [Amylibacter marinus]|uniref:ABM domain-containing protein n=1 Tax=Amylibacter marinus TaxID=1475483 RepID=A0ABQ5VSR2_9RHOB|nr:antibiotic biosynthesis monooxygenase [Amylibacter marinus]GLQ34467.1 hypothetical protein GCM10007939_07500 [Amylibacter marinus]
MSVIRVTGHIDVPSDRLSAVQEAMAEHISLTHEEEGCLFFSITPCPDVAGRFLVSEAFKSQEDFDQHQIRTHKSHWGKVTSGIARNFTIQEDGKGGDN